MTPAELAADLRTRINPVYADQLGTESYERRICADVIFQLLKESGAQRKVLEQTLEALNDITSEISMKRFWREKDEKRFDEIAEEAITAIQGVLNV